MHAHYRKLENKDKPKEDENYVKSYQARDNEEYNI